MTKDKARTLRGVTYLLGCCFFLTCKLATAQSSDTVSSGVSELDTITVVGTVDNLQGLDFYSPNSSAVINSTQIEEMGARSLDQALQYQSGILAEPFGPDNKVDWFKIRGFDASIAIDGAPNTPSGYYVWKQEVFGLESIEVIKGSNSLIFGASETGGVVNLVTKKPHKYESFLLNAELGNNSRKGLGLDYNGLLNSNIYYRIVAQAREEDGMQDHTNMKSYYLAPSMTIDFSEKTSLTLLSSIQHEDGRPTNGFLPAYGTIYDTPYGLVNRHTNMGEPDFDHLKRTQVSAGWLFSHEFVENWKFLQNYKYTYLDLNQQNVYAFTNSSTNDRNAARGYSFIDGKTKSHYFDNRVTGKIHLADGLDLEPTVGIDYLKSDTSGNNNGFGGAPELDMFDPVYGVPFSVDYLPYETRSKQLGLYASAKLYVGQHWNFNVGLRHDKAKGNSFIDGDRNSYDVSNNSFNAGAMYISDFGVSPYISYSESFKPENGIDGYGNPYVPFIGKQAEIGLKIEPEWINGTFTIAYFDIKEKNALAADASNIQKQIGERTNKGIEIQGDLAITENTNARFSYTYNDSKQDLSETETIRTAMIPRHQASLWVDHSFNLNDSGRLTLAAGVRYVGSTEDQQFYKGEPIPSYTLLDLMARYQINRNFSLQLNARNVTNKTYVSGCDFYCYYGNDRSVDMQLQYQWN